MATRFTTEEAYEASDCGEPIMLGAEDVARICRRQQSDDCTPDQFYADHPALNGQFDAAVLLGWLGY